MQLALEIAAAGAMLAAWAWLALLALTNVAGRIGQSFAHCLHARSHSSTSPPI